MLTHLLLATALVLCFDGRALWLPLAAAERGGTGDCHRELWGMANRAPFDRFPPIIPTNRTPERHQVLPNEAIIQVVGSQLCDQWVPPTDRVMRLGQHLRTLMSPIPRTNDSPTPVPAVDLINDPTHRL